MTLDLFREVIGVATHHLHEPPDDKPHGTLYVLVPEFYPFQDGIQHSDDSSEFDEKVKDGFNTRRTTKHELTTTIRTTFLGTDSNRSMPDIHMGERVKVITFGNSRKYYWVPYFPDEHLRNNEHITFRAANTPTRIKILDNDNTYYLTINTWEGKKQITFGTSLSDEESVMYTFSMLPEEQISYWEDNLGNWAKLESAETRWTVRNAVNSFATIDKSTITARTSDEEDLIYELSLIPTEQTAFLKDNKDNHVTLQSLVPEWEIINTNGTHLKLTQDDIYGVAPRNIFLKCKGISLEYDRFIEKGNTKLSDVPSIGCNGALVVQQTLDVTGGIHSPSPIKVGGVLAPVFSNATPPPGGDLPSVTVEGGAGSGGSGTAGQSNAGSTNAAQRQRHSAAWEEVSKALELIAADLSKLDGRSGTGVRPVGVSSSAIVGLAKRAIMKNNQGI